MRVVFLLESAELWGGVKTVFQDAAGLAARGHHVVVLCKGAAPDWIEPGCEFRTVPDFAAAHVPAADVVVGTYWTTVPFAAAAGRGVPVHYCQGYEGDNPECAPHRAAIAAIYADPNVAKVTISPHLARLLAARFGVRSRSITYAIDDAAMYPAPERPAARPWRVGLVGAYAVAWKDLRTGLRACALLHAAGAPVRVVRASNAPRHADETDLPFAVEWHGRVAPAAMGELYRSLDVFVATSRGTEEGFFMPAVEAMACGIPCVLTDIPCARGYDHVHDYSLFVPPGDPAAMAKAIVEVAGDAVLRRRLRAAGLRVAARYTRARHLDELEAALREAAARARPAAAALGPGAGGTAALAVPR
jgi:glycosyltransferase involved in cell wall biosynthesis